MNARLAEEGLTYSGRTRISHFLWVLHENIGEIRLRELVVNPLTDLTVAAFYGCHITRPPLRYGFIDSRNNSALETLSGNHRVHLIRLGAEFVSPIYREGEDVHRPHLFPAGLSLTNE